MAIREIASIDELESLRPAWLALCQRSSTATPFQSPDWLIPWWKHFGDGRLCVLVLHDDRRLIGIAPFFVKRQERSALRLVGTGNTDYLDVLLDDGAVDASAAAIFSYLCGSHWWDEIYFDNLRQSSPLLKRNECAELVECVEEQDVCPVVALPGSVDQLVDKLPARLQHNLRYYRRKLDALGEVKIECANEENFDELFDAFLRLHEARWRMNNQPGMLSNENVRSFLREATKGFLIVDALRLYGLRVDRQIAASLCAFHHARRTYYYLGGFAPEFKQYSPGTILVAHAIGEAIRERAKEFDFLRGREDYKYRWGAVDRTIFRKRLERSRRKQATP